MKGFESLERRVKDSVWPTLISASRRRKCFVFARNNFDASFPVGLIWVSWFLWILVNICSRDQLLKMLPVPPTITIGMGILKSEQPHNLSGWRTWAGAPGFCSKPGAHGQLCRPSSCPSTPLNQTIVGSSDDLIQQTFTYYVLFLLFSYWPTNYSALDYFIINNDVTLQLLM